MKILVVVPYFEEPHRWMVSGQKTARELAKTHQVIVVTTGQTDSVAKEHDKLTIYRLRDIFLRDPINYSVIPGLSRKLKEIVRRENPDTFLINKHMFFSSLAIFPLKKLGKKVVVQTDTFPGINWFPKSKLVGVVMWLYARLIGNRILRAADKVVLLHEGLIPVAKQLNLNYEVIHNGIDLEEFDAAQPPADLKKKPDEIWIGYVGRLESVKGWYDLAAVAKEMVATDKRLNFFFVGPADNASVTEFEAERIKFIGARQDVAGFDKLLDIFVMPSYSEGLSNALMEAMAAGCACVVTNVGGNKVLVKDGTNGLTYRAGNISGLAGQLRRLIDDPSYRALLGGAARKTIEAEFNLGRNLSRLVNIFSSI